MRMNSRKWLLVKGAMSHDICDHADCLSGKNVKQEDNLNH